ncbi:MAG: nitroreductase family protein [Ilumatobacteraceae bacterium]
MEFTDVVFGRRMTRAFSKRVVEPQLLDQLVDLASRAPSAGKTQGWHLIVIERERIAEFWDATFPVETRAEFKWKQLFDAPVIAIAFADADAYVRRYGEADKKSTGLGDGPEAWPTPYWTVDASFAVMTLLLAAQDAGLGALFFAVFNGAEEVRKLLGVPEHLQLIGALALGWPLETLASSPSAQRGVSASRHRRSSAEIIHRQNW